MSESVTQKTVLNLLSSDMFQKPFSADKDIESYRKDGGCKTADQQKRLKEYQELKREFAQ